MIEKKALIEAIANKASIDMDSATVVVNEVIAEMVSPALFATPGAKPVFFGDNNCNNNCKENLAAAQLKRG